MGSGEYNQVDSGESGAIVELQTKEDVKPTLACSSLCSRQKTIPQEEFLEGFFLGPGMVSQALVCVAGSWMRRWAWWQPNVDICRIGIRRVEAGGWGGCWLPAMLTSRVKSPE